MLFKILQGDSSRISSDITPLHPGWCYFTPDDGKLYIDSADDNGSNQKRTCIGKSRAVAGTLGKNSWISGRQTLSVDGLQENQNGIIDIAQGATDAQMAAAKSADMYVYSQTDGALTVACLGNVPQVDIPVVTILLI